MLLPITPNTSADGQQRQPQPRTAISKLQAQKECSGTNKTAEANANFSNKGSWTPQNPCNAMQRQSRSDPTKRMRRLRGRNPGRKATTQSERAPTGREDD
eukprot:2173617-Amphidinium_carterae.1